LNRRTVAFAFAAVAVGLGGAGTVVALHRGPLARTAATHQAAPSGTARSAEQQAEDAFIGATAAHMCNVQLTVYDDPKALADAYRAAPEYPGLTADQVTDLQRRLVTDAALTDRLAKQLQATCRASNTR